LRTFNDVFPIFTFENNLPGNIIQIQTNMSISHVSANQRRRQRQVFFILLSERSNETAKMNIYRGKIVVEETLHIFFNS
jgi:hypothetical protein